MIDNITIMVLACSGVKACAWHTVVTRNSNTTVKKVFFVIVLIF